nr:outer membrane protein assembly factor BamC [Volucribacter amazonae]
MKKIKYWLLPFIALGSLSACSSDNQEKQQANDPFVEKEIPTFSPLNSGGVNLPQPDPRFNIPAEHIPTSGLQVDIRPPVNPLPIIHDSIAQFDGERASIVYPADKQAVYNLQQVARLLNEQGIAYQQENGKIITDWTSTGRADEVGNVQLRYQIEQLGNQQASALAISILQAKRDNVIFTPTVVDKQRYAAGRLNQLVGELNIAYQQQQQQLATSSNIPLNSTIATDRNGRQALIAQAGFNATWQKLAQILPSLGFSIEEENIGRGYRELKYRALDELEWRRFGVARPDLAKGEYKLQIAVVGNNTAIVFTDEDDQPLDQQQAEAVYQALQRLLAN